MNKFFNTEELPDIVEAYTPEGGQLSHDFTAALCEALKLDGVLLIAIRGPLLTISTVAGTAIADLKIEMLKNALLTATEALGGDVKNVAKTTVRKTDEPPERLRRF